MFAPDSLLGGKLDILHNSAQAVRLLGVKGAVAELGVFKGGALARLATLFPDETVFGLDTWTGIPEQDAEIDYHRVGDFGEVDYDALLRWFWDERPNVRLIRGDVWKTIHFLDGIMFSVVHLDMDQYAVTKMALEYFAPRIADGGCIVLDDYQWTNCRGIERAITETHPLFAEWRHEPIGNQYILWKPMPVSR